MRQSTLLALSAPLLALAKPLVHERLHKRHEITSTIYEEVTVTVDVTVTVYGPSPQAQAEADVEITLNEPQKNQAEPTGHTEAAGYDGGAVRIQEPPKPTGPAGKSPLDHQKEQEEIQEKQKKIQEDLIRQQEGHKDTQKHSGEKKPEPSKPESQPKQPSQPEKQPDKQPEKQPENNQPTSGQGPSGGSCGEVGGKCLASDVTIYDDQGIGACGWQNDTNTEDYFALAADTFGGYTNDAPGPHKNKYCGRMATISVDGKQIQGMVTDKCPGCTGHSIDLSKCLWNKVFNGEAPTRKFQIEWWFSGPEVFHGPGA